MEKTNKEKFIYIIEREIFERNDIYVEGYSDYFEGARKYFELLKRSKDTKEKKKFTENGEKILRYMQQVKDKYDNMFKASDIGEGLEITSRTASGAMRKLVTDGYLEKIGDHPTVYSLTDIGINESFEAE